MRKQKIGCRAAVVATFLIAATLQPRRADGQTVDDSEGQAVHLLQRATYGPRPEDITRVLDMGIEGWLAWQMEPASIDDSALTGRLAAFDAAVMSPAELYAAYPPPGVIRRQLEGGDSLTPQLRRELMREMGILPPGRIVADLAGARLQRAVYSERQLEQIMTDFWFNHFNVFWGKGPARWLVADFEEQAIRPHVFGTFEEMLVAVAQHPAMLVYLDNWRSTASGINENYARELLELHTLGVDGGYMQADVVEVARAFTGWTLARGPASRRGEFVFRPDAHDNAEKFVLGAELPAGRGIEDGIAVLQRLATHLSTARHLTTKLVETFVADSAPPALVEDLTRVFLETDGDLAAMTRALFLAPELRAATSAGKVRSPFELLAAALRMTEADVGPSRTLLGALRAFDHVPYLESAPTGYPEASEEWISSGAMLQRMNLALALAGGDVEGVTIDTAEPGVGVPGDRIDGLLAALLPSVETARLETLIRADLASEDMSEDQAERRALGLILGSPEFQHH